MIYDTLVTPEPEPPREQLLSEPYDTPLCQKIRGFGEIYEMTSVEHLRMRLIRRGYAHDNILILAPKDCFLRDIIDGREILEAGFVDRPPWPSRPKDGGSKPSDSSCTLAGIVFQVLVIFEQWNKPHMKYVLLRGGK
jgi:hypothetical protein